MKIKALMAVLLLAGCATKLRDPQTGKVVFETYADARNVKYSQTSGSTVFECETLIHSTPTRAAGSVLGTGLTGGTALMRAAIPMP